MIRPREDEKPVSMKDNCTGERMTEATFLDEEVIHHFDYFALGDYWLLSPEERPKVKRLKQNRGSALPSFPKRPLKPKIVGLAPLLHFNQIIRKTNFQQSVVCVLV